MIILRILGLILLATLCRSDTLELDMSEEMPIGSTIADLRTLITKSGKPPGSQWATFKSMGSDDIGSRLVEVSLPSKR